jgi:dynactin complex subunit
MEFGPGTVRYVGNNTKINPGWWVGVELDKACACGSVFY